MPDVIDDNHYQVYRGTNTTMSVRSRELITYRFVIWLASVGLNEFDQVDSKFGARSVNFTRDPSATNVGKKTKPRTTESQRGSTKHHKEDRFSRYTRPLDLLSRARYIDRLAIKSWFDPNERKGTRGHDDDPARSTSSRLPK